MRGLFIFLKIAALLKRCDVSLARCADALEALAEGQQRQRGTGLRTFYEDFKNDGAEFMAQSDEDFAELERLEQQREKRGGAPMDATLEELDE